MAGDECGGSIRGGGGSIGGGGGSIGGGGGSIGGARASGNPGTVVWVVAGRRAGLTVGGLAAQQAGTTEGRHCKRTRWAQQTRIRHRRRQRLQNIPKGHLPQRRK